MLSGSKGTKALSAKRVTALDGSPVIMLFGCNLYIYQANSADAVKCSWSPDEVLPDPE